MIVRSILSLALLAMPVAASAGDHAKVRHADLNLTSPAGQTALEGRVKTAIRKLCGVADARGLAETMPATACARAAHADARAKMQVAIRNAATASQLAAAPLAPGG